jgi:hypothetical protein
MPQRYKYPDLSKRSKFDVKKSVPKGIGPVTSVILLCSVIFLILLWLYYGRETCYDCYKKDPDNTFHFCREEGETIADFDIRMNLYRREGYKCE